MRLLLGGLRESFGGRNHDASASRDATSQVKSVHFRKLLTTTFCIYRDNTVLIAKFLFKIDRTH